MAARAPPESPLSSPPDPPLGTLHSRLVQTRSRAHPMVGVHASPRSGGSVVLGGGGGVGLGGGVLELVVPVDLVVDLVVTSMAPAFGLQKSTGLSHGSAVSHHGPPVSPKATSQACFVPQP